MRIALDCRSVFPGHGGIGRYAEALAARLPQLHSEAEYLLLTTPRQEDPLCRLPNVRQVAVEAGMIDERWDQLQLPGLLYEEGIDLYHNPCFSVPVVPCVRWLVTTIHDVIFRVYPHFVDERLRGYLERWTAHAAAHAGAVITVSDYSRRELCQCYGISRDRVAVIPNGVDSRFRPASKAARRKVRTQLGLPEGFVLYVGAIEAKKNIDLLLQASAEFDGLPLVLTGGRGGQEFDLAAAIARHGVGSHVRHLGYVDDATLPALMSAATVFVYPSLYEGFGLPALEAMACGTPVVVSDATCLPEVVGDAALVFPAADRHALANTVRMAAHDETTRKQLSKAGLARAAEFTWDRCAKATLEVYRALWEAGSS